jgi:hypothetical protein
MSPVNIEYHRPIGKQHMIGEAGPRMNIESQRIFVDCVCSRTGKSWKAAMERMGSVWAFAKHYLPDEFEEIKRRAAAEFRGARRQELLPNVLPEVQPKLLTNGKRTRGG